MCQSGRMFWLVLVRLVSLLCIWCSGGHPIELAAQFIRRADDAFPYEGLSDFIETIQGNNLLEAMLP